MSKSFFLLLRYLLVLYINFCVVNKTIHQFEKLLQIPLNNESVFFFKLFTPKQFCYSHFLKKEPSLVFFWKKYEGDEAITTNLGALRCLYILFIKKKWNRVNAFEDQCILFSFWLKNTFSLHQNWNRFLLLFPRILNLFHSGSIGLFLPQWHWTHFIQHLSTHLCIKSHYFH